MPSAFRNQKNLNEWLELDYYQRPRGLRRWRNRLTLLLFVLCAAGVAGAIFLLGSRSARLVQAGPVTSAHSMFNHECEWCHRESFQTAQKFLPGNASMRVVPDEACIQCHDGPPHNLLQNNPDEVRCATCHREHRGRPLLARVPDGECTVCHADLKNHRKGGDTGLAFKDVHAFNDDHPEFRLKRDKDTDKAQLAFNHEFHLVKLAGLPKEKFARLAEPLKRLKEEGCVHCHRPDPAGRYMKPINYENHCAECHPLSVQLTGDFKAEKPADQRRLDEAIKEFNKKPAPHKEPSVVRAALRERLLDFVQVNRVVAGEAEEGAALIDRGLLGKRPTVEQWKWVNNRLDTLERVLFTSDQLDVAERGLFRHNCNHCHIEKKDRPRDKNDDGLAGLPVYEKTNIPLRWLGHARFSHQHHRSLNCTECHEAKTSRQTSDVLMPSVDNCKQCHNPSVGVRNDCVECHHYHDRRHAHEIHKNWTIERSLGK
jgi:hypothetical protein